mmetsp:Transcript_10832/g.26001  ORF Transcript_10832/g.26001 Transcript_10832/m.26001 type:complete len:481 (+) Transcript_10832:74-1516(+)
MKSTVSSHERMPTISVFPLRLLALVGLGCCILAGFNISGVTSSQQQQQPEHYSTTMWSDEYPSSSGSPSVDDPLIFVFRLLYRQLEYVIRPLYSENKHTGGIFFSSFAAASQSEYHGPLHTSYASSPARFTSEEHVNYSKRVSQDLPFASEHHGVATNFPSPWFDSSKTTEENYRLMPGDELSNNQEFTTQEELRQSLLSRSKFESIRKNLDYSYHSIYTLGRQQFQDELIQSLLEKARPSDCPALTDLKQQQENNQHWIVFTAGVMGAGKTFTLEWLRRHGMFPLERFVSVDPDHIRRLLPEFDVYLQQGHAHKAGEATRKEAGMLTEMLTTAALNRGQHVVVDGTLRDADWYQAYFAQLRRDYPGIKIAILHVTASPEAVLQRARKRAKVTGRIVPVELLQRVMQQVPASVRLLKEKVDVFVELFNGENDHVEDSKEGSLGIDKGEGGHHHQQQHQANIHLVEPSAWTWNDFAHLWDC